MSVHTRMHELLRNAHFCACPQLHPSVRVHLAHGVFLAPPRTDPYHLIGGLAGSWLLLAPSLTWLQGVPLCLAETWCKKSILGLSLEYLCWSSRSFSKRYAPCLFLLKSGSPLSSLVPCCAFHTLHTWSVLALDSGSRCWIPSHPHHVARGIPFTENTWI